MTGWLVSPFPAEEISINAKPVDQKKELFVWKVGKLASDKDQMTFIEMTRNKLSWECHTRRYKLR